MACCTEAEGCRLSRYVAAAKASAQYGGGMEAWSLEQQSADGVVDGAKYAFSFTVSLGGVGAREAQADAVAGEEVSSGPVEELGAIISLKCFGGDAELRTSKAMNATRWR